MKNCSFLCVKTVSFIILFSVCSVRAQPEVIISGKISDTLYNPIAGASVALVNYPTLSTVTDSSGFFFIEHTPTQTINNNTAIDLESTVSMTSNGLIINQSFAGVVKVTIYNMKGAVISSLFDGGIDAGSHHFSIPAKFASAALVIGITQNNSTRYIKKSSIHATLRSSRGGIQSISQNNPEKRVSNLSLGAVDTLVIEKESFDIKKIAIDSYVSSASTLLNLTFVPLMIPSYEPDFWNDNSTTKKNNNCYNYACNKKTDTFAQPGRASGDKYTSSECDNVGPAAVRDGLEICDSITQPLPPGKARVAMAVSYQKDYHWWREDIDGMWSHKPGDGRATNYDNSDDLISDPEKADRGRYEDFCGYYFVDSDSIQGEGHEDIRFASPMSELIAEWKLESSSKMKVTIKIFSGRENPYFFINDKKIFNAVTSLIEKAQKIDNYPLETVEPSILGYRGVEIQCLTDNDIFIDEYTVYKNDIEHFNGNYKRKIFMNDASHIIEKLLLDEALVQNVIDNELREIICEEMNK